MKKLPIAAVALFFGTSAFAMAPSTAPTGVQVDKDPYTVTGTNAVDTAAHAYALQPAAVDWWGTAPAVEAKTIAYASDDADAAWAAAAADKAAADSGAVDEDVETAVDEAADEAALEPAVETLEPVAVGTGAADDEPVPVENGVGGPEEGIDTAAVGVAPRAAAQNYPACRPGQGDDRCIQLYEPGVRAELASWNQQTGGFAGAGEVQVADSGTETERLNQLALADSASALQTVRMAAAEPVAADAVAMGGPYEPVDDAALMNGDGTVDTAMGETGTDEAVGV